MKSLNVTFEPWTYAYRIFGTRVERLLPYFQDLRTSMKTGGVTIALPAYLSFMILVSIITFASAMIIVPFLLPLLLHTSLLSVENIGLSLLFALAFSVLTFLILYLYPSVKSNNRKGPIDINLPYITNFLALLSSSNVPPRTIFRSVVTIRTLKEIRQDFSNIVRDVELFGQDLLTSIMENIRYIPSTRLGEILSGYVSMIRTGGNPTQYLRTSTENVMKERLVKLDLMLESLSALAEIYIMVLVAMPLLFIVMFATLGMIGSGSESMNPALMINLLAYLGIPIMASVLIVIIDAYTSR